MPLIKKIKNKLGTIIYPETLTKAIYDEDGNRLDNILSQSNFDKSSGVLVNQANAYYYREGNKVIIFGKILMNAQSLDFTLPYKPSQYLYFPTVGCDSSDNPTTGYIGRGKCNKNSASCNIKLSGANTYAMVNFAYLTDDPL